MPPTEPSIATIRAAINANRGGHETTTDGGLLALWRSLPADTRAAYLAAVEKKPAPAPVK